MGLMILGSVWLFGGVMLAKLAWRAGRIGQAAVFEVCVAVGLTMFLVGLWTVLN